jgi:hypothetical protein
MTRMRLEDQGSGLRLEVAVLQYELSAYRLWGEVWGVVIPGLVVVGIVG